MPEGLSVWLVLLPMASSWLSKAASYAQAAQEAAKEAEGF